MHALSTVSEEFPRLWQDLWDVRTPFLDSEVSCMNELELHKIIMQCVVGLSAVLRTHRCVEDVT